MKNLKTARKELGITQKEIASIINVSQQCYSDYENGKTAPDLMTLSKIADVLNTTVDYLLGRTDDFGNLVNSNPSIANKQPSDLSGNRDKYLVDFEKYFNLLTEIQKAQVLGYVMGLLEQNGIKVNSLK